MAIFEERGEVTRRQLDLKALLKPAPQLCEAQHKGCTSTLNLWGCRQATFGFADAVRSSIQFPWCLNVIE